MCHPQSFPFVEGHIGLPVFAPEGSIRAEGEGVLIPSWRYAAEQAQCL